MGTKAGVGHSFHRNPAEAGKEAAMKALEQAGIAKPDFVCVREIGANAKNAGERLGQEIKPLLSADSIACYLFADGLVFNFDLFLPWQFPSWGDESVYPEPIMKSQIQ